MKELAERGLNAAEVRGADYADVRILYRESENITVKNGVVEAHSRDSERGLGIRVLADGAWGFAASADLSPDSAEGAAERAVQIANASALVPGPPLNLGPPEVHRASYRTPVEIDPFAVPIESKLDLLLRADEEMRRIPGVRVSQAEMGCIRESKLFASSEGSVIDQEIIESGAGLESTAIGEDDEVQSRSYPNSGGHYATAGYEFVKEMGLAGHAARVSEEAVALLTAKPCPDTTTDLVLGSAQMYIQIHESCGHPTELDRVLGTEAAYAGTSFLTPDKLGSSRYGSEIVNLSADAVTPRGLGTFGYDDEGVPAQRTPLVKDGIFVGYLTSRETAARFGMRSNGTMRADGWNRIPLIRMTNVSLEPGEWTLDDLLADTETGIYMETNRSWSIDDRRLNFQFGTEIGYEIRDGKLGEMLRNPTYTGMTPEFWGSCDAICDSEHWALWGTIHCGKGQPSQVAHTGHGAAPARFRNVRVGVMR